MKDDITSATFTKQLENAPFKTAFKATMGFYVAQTLVTFAGMGLLVAIILTAAYLLK